MHLFGFVEGMATLLYARFPRPVSLRVPHGFQLVQVGVTSLELGATAD